MYEWQASLFDNDNLSSPLTFKTEQKTVKYPFRLKTAALLNKNQPSEKWLFLTFYVKVNECCF